MKTRINKHKLYVYTLHDRCRVLVTLELMIWWLGKATSMFFFNSWAFDHWTIGGLPLNFFFGFTPNKWGFLKRGYPKSGKIMKPFYTMYFFTIEPMVLGRVDLFFLRNHQNNRRWFRVWHHWDDPPGHPLLRNGPRCWNTGCRWGHVSLFNGWNTWNGSGLDVDTPSSGGRWGCWMLRKINKKIDTCQTPKCACVCAMLQLQGALPYTTFAHERR